MPPTIERPTRLPLSNRYEFQKPLGGGGMGIVYRALDRRTGGLVAIKVLNFKLSENPTLHHRLAREFRAATELEHPNIVRALEYENDGEISFVVYELIEGGSLGARIDQHGRIPEDDAIRIITQIAQALHYAHERQVIHRDVKPDNILILTNGRAKLTDFGLAKDYNNDCQDLTRHASGLGTPHFMAPEQFADAKAADARCDVYSLGATLWNMLTGRLPFDAKVPIAILTKKERCEIPMARSLVPGLSERVDLAIRAALNPDPARRPISCLAFFKSLTARRRVRENILRTPAPCPTAAKGDERRIWARYPLTVGSCGSIDTAVHSGDGSESSSEERWPLVVQDVSAGGIGVLLARRFEQGTVLSIELLDGLTDQPQRFNVCVVRVQAERGGHWVHGCKFQNPLDDIELKSLLKFA